MTAALALQPASPDLQKLHRAAIATRSLTLLFRAYHLALLDATVARHSPDAATRRHHATRAEGRLRNAIGHVVDYAGAMLAATATAADGHPALARFRLAVERLYVGTPLCIVHESVHQFAEEFGGMDLPAHFTAAIAAQRDRGSPAAPGPGAGLSR